MTLQSKNRSDQLMLLLPVIIPVLILSVIPLLRGIYLGFTDYRLGGGATFNGLDNYRFMLRDTYFWRSFGVGFLWTILVTGGQVVLGLGLALLLNSKIRFTSVYSILMLTPWAMPPIIRGIVWKQIYDPDSGALNSILLNTGILSSPVNWLYDYQYVFPAIIFAGIWGEIPKVAVFMLAGLQGIPSDLYEAAHIDGANARNRFYHITLPLLRPITAIIISLNFMWNFNTFGLVWVLTQGGPGGLTRLPMLAAYEEAFRYGYIGYAAAIGNVMVIIITVILFVYLRVQFRERVA